MNRLQKWLLLGIIILAIFFRFYQIVALPGGLFPDEAANGLDINLMQQGQLQPFYERSNGRESLFFYMLWGSVEVFGKGPWQHHIVSALIGLLSVLGCFLVTKKLFSLNAQTDLEKQRAINIALMASFFMAVSTWHIVLSRTAFRANLIPLFSSFTIYFLLNAFTSITKKKRYFWAILSGAFFALGFYTYIAYRIMALILAVAFFWPTMVDWIKQRFQYTKVLFIPALLFIISFGIFILPLANYFNSHPGSFIGRSGQVSIFNPNLYLVNGEQIKGEPNTSVVLNVLGEVTKQSLLGYFTVGDLNWRHNISGFPFLSPIISPFFAIGLILCLIMAVLYIFKPQKYSNGWKFFILTGWFWGMLIPVVTTAEGIPHGLRSIGTIPAVFIITSWGLYWTISQIKKIIQIRHEDQKPWKLKIIHGSFILLTICFIVALIVQAYSLYFIYAARSPENHFAFRSDLTTVSNYLNDRQKLGLANKSNTYLVLDKFSVQTTDYLTSLDAKHPENPVNQPYTQVDPENSWELNNLKFGDQVIFTQSSIFDIKKFKQFHPQIVLRQEVRNQFGQSIMAVYEVK
jgi:hypothetical protein